jgi:hypothetical protein
MFQKGDFRNKDHNSEKVYWVRNPAKMFSVARERSTIEEWRKEKNVSAILV